MDSSQITNDNSIPTSTPTERKEIAQGGLEGICGVPVRVVGERIPDFLGGVDSEAAERILTLPGDLASLEAALEEGRANQTVYAALQTAGIFNSEQRLTNLGGKLVYHIRERRRQAGADGLAETILEQCKLSENSRVLDVGCGAGQTLILLSPWKPAEQVGLDIDLESLALGCRIAGEMEQKINFVRGSATMLPFRDGYFSHVFSRVTLNYVHQRTALAEQVRVLRPGGYLYCRAEGPGYDLRCLAATRRLRPLASSAYDFLLGLGLSATGRQLQPGRFPAAGRAFTTVRRLARFLQRQGCKVVDVRIGARYAGLPAAIELLAKKHDDPVVVSGNNR